MAKIIDSHSGKQKFFKGKGRIGSKKIDDYQITLIEEELKQKWKPCYEIFENMADFKAFKEEFYPETNTKIIPHEIILEAELEFYDVYKGIDYNAMKTEYILVRKEHGFNK